MATLIKVVDHSKQVTPRVADHIKDRIEKFGHFYEGVKECRVTVDAPAQGRYRVRLSLSVPNSQIAVNRQTGADLAMAIRESFDAADQRLEDYVRLSKDAASRGSRRSKRK